MRFVGEPVAVVLADDPHIAEQAVQLISAEYDELPAVFDEVEALKPDVIVHDVLKPAGTFADLKHLAGKKDTNVALDYHLRRGDVDTAFAAPITSSSTRSRPSSACTCRSSRSCRSPSPATTC